MMPINAFLFASVLFPPQAFCAAVTAPSVTIAPVGLALPAMPLPGLRAPLSGSPSALPLAPLNLTPASLKQIPLVMPAPAIAAQLLRAPIQAKTLPASEAPSFLKAFVPAGMFSPAQARENAPSAERQHRDASILFDGDMDRKAASPIPVLPFS
ncbi:MAG: hypothetical protein WCI75_19400, partial [candidate division NC10 bacterium]